MQLHGKHNLLIYKFSFVYDHIVLPTIDFMPQEQSLDVVDFRAIWTAMQGSDAFSSYNCGFESGARCDNSMLNRRRTIEYYLLQYFLPSPSLRVPLSWFNRVF